MASLARAAARPGRPLSSLAAVHAAKLEALSLNSAAAATVAIEALLLGLLHVKDRYAVLRMGRDRARSMDGRSRVQANRRRQRLAKFVLEQIASEREASQTVKIAQAIWTRASSGVGKKSRIRPAWHLPTVRKMEVVRLTPCFPGWGSWPVRPASLAGNSA